MNKGLVFGAGLGIGSGLMFLLDPDRGKRRRALLRDKMFSATRKIGEGVEGAALDLRNRAQGLIHEAQSRFSSEPVDDATLVRRVRAHLGHVMSRPSSTVEVTAQDGKVTLSGPIPSQELSKVLGSLKHVHGVKNVVANPA
jgi:osmotically-inducible protein OsmY